MVTDRERDVTLRGLMERGKLRALVDAYDPPKTDAPDAPRRAAWREDDERAGPATSFQEAMLAEMQVGGAARAANSQSTDGAACRPSRGRAGCEGPGTDSETREGTRGRSCIDSGGGVRGRGAFPDARRRRGCEARGARGGLQPGGGAGK